MDHPKLDRGQDRDGNTHPDVRPQGIGNAHEPEQPGSDSHPQAKDEVDPLLPPPQLDHGGEREAGDQEAADPGVPGRRLLAGEAEEPRRDEQKGRGDRVEDVDRRQLAVMLQCVRD